MRAKLEASILTLFAAAIVVVFTLAGIVWKISDDAHDATAHVAHSLEDLLAIAAAEAQIYRVESSVRGYLVSGNPARLAERDAAVASLKATLGRLAELGDGDAEHEQRRERLRAALDERLAILAHIAALREREGLEAARAHIAGTPQREASRQTALEILGEMEAEERAWLQARAGERHRLSDLASIVGAATALLFAALLISAHLLIRRQMNLTEAAALGRKALLDAADVALISSDTQGVIRTFNPAAERMLGYTSAELIGSQTPAILHVSEEIAARARQLSEELNEPIAPGFEVFTAKARRDQPDANEWTYVRKDGGRLRVLLSVSALRDATGRLTGFLGVATDVTTSVEAERMVVRERDRLELALSAAGMAMWDADVRSGQVSLDKRWAAMLGGAPAATLTTIPELLTLAPAADQARLLAIADDVVAGRRPEYVVEHQVRAADGGWRWIHSQGKVVERDAEGRALRMIGINSDITARKSMELHLAAKEAQLRLITENVPAMIGYYDSGGICRFSNAAHSEFFGRRATRILGERVQEIVGPQAYREIEPYVLKVLAGEAVHYERMDRDTAGAERTLSVNLMPDRTDGGQVAGYYVMMLDITERAQAARALVAAKEAAESANRAKDAFVAVMSHEIRTPLNGMLGMLELLNLSRLDGEQRQTLEAARDSGNSLVRIIDDVLDHAKIEAGKLEIRPEPASIAALIRRVANMYAAVASGKGLILQQAADPRISPWLLADMQRLMQILGNFVSNAIKFTAEGHVEIRAELVERKGGAETVRLSVKDTGIGIAPEAQQRLFTPFEQAGADTSRLYGGTGLGLAISRRLAGMMGGAIAVESAPGKGTTMALTLTLPISDGRLQTENGHASAPLHPVSAIATNPASRTPLPELLVVDDHPINRQLLERQLGALGLRSRSAADGKEALALWQRQPFPLIITDCHMPGLDGYALSQAVRETEAREGRPRTPIIAWTANVLADAAARCRDAGMDDLLTKPATLPALHEILSRWLPAGAVDSLAARAKGAGAAPPPIDLAQLDQIVASAEERAAILQHYVAQTRSDLADLAAAMQGTDLAASGHIAHRVKGASRTVGAHRLALACEELESAACTNDVRGAAAAYAAIDRALKDIDAHLAAQGGTIKEEEQ